MATITPNYLELSSSNVEATKAFYAAALGFSFTDYGPGYVAVEGGAVELGFAKAEVIAPPLPTFETDNLEAALVAVTKAGAKMVKEIFAYPGGRRFEFLDPDGNHLAIYQKG